MRVLLALSMLLGSVAAAVADPCVDRFRQLLTQPRSEGPVKILVTQAVKGGPTTKNYNHQTGTGDWMTEMIEPPTMPWTLVRDNVMYVSNDRGGSWSKVRDLDSKANEAASGQAMKEAAQTVRNAECGSETIEGMALDVIAADYDVPKYKTSHRDTFWVEPETGRISRSKSVTRASGFESTVTQVIERVREVKLPRP